MGVLGVGPCWRRLDGVPCPFRGRGQSRTGSHISFELMSSTRVQRGLPPVYVSPQPLQSWTTLCDPIYCSLPGSSVHGDSPGKNPGVVAMPTPGHLSHSGIEPVSLMSPALADGFFTTNTTWEAPPSSLLLLSRFSRVRRCATP